MMDVVSEAVRASLIVLELFSPPPGDCNVQQVQYDGVVLVLVLGWPYTVTEVFLPCPSTLNFSQCNWWLDTVKWS